MQFMGKSAHSLIVEPGACASALVMPWYCDEESDVDTEDMMPAGSESSSDSNSEERSQLTRNCLAGLTFVALELDLARKGQWPARRPKDLSRRGLHPAAGVQPNHPICCEKARVRAVTNGPLRSTAHPTD